MLRAMRQYPKLLLFAASCILAYLLLQEGVFSDAMRMLRGYDLPSYVVAGMFFSLGFTSPFAVAFFVDAAPHANPFSIALWAGIGALVADMAIFTIARLSFADEVQRLHGTVPIQRLKQLLRHEHWPRTVRSYVLWSFAALFIASPLPDELGLTLLGTVSDVRGLRLSVLCFVLNTTGILFIVLGAVAFA